MHSGRVVIDNLRSGSDAVDHTIPGFNTELALASALRTQVHTWRSESPEKGVFLSACVPGLADGPNLSRMLLRPPRPLVG